VVNLYCWFYGIDDTISMTCKPVSLFTFPIDFVVNKYHTHLNNKFSFASGKNGKIREYWENYESGPEDMSAETPQTEEHPTSVIQPQSGFYSAYSLHRVQFHKYGTFTLSLLNHDITLIMIMY